MRTIIKNQTKVISTKYYKNRLWKITVRIYHIHPGSIYKDHKNRYTKEYYQRDEVGVEWKFINITIIKGFNA